jgi:hypothetical protein
MTRPGGKPVIAVPGLTPRSPTISVGPVLVTVEAPKTAKLSAVPRVWENADEAHRNRRSPTIPGITRTRECVHSMFYTFSRG